MDMATSFNRLPLLPTARRLLTAAVLAAVASCASSGFVPQTTTMPAARASLSPEYRIFYDALQDYGDWVLIEPFGFVFRPRVDFATFRPYQEGFWAPSDSWGWVWISAEPFGWATYHYGTWFWDRFQGWVWVPGVDWGPAWVNWQIASGYAGWAPLWPSGGSLGSQVPGGPYLYAPLSRLGSTDLRAHLATRATLGARVEGAQPVENVVERAGVQVQLGPPFSLVERVQGAPLAKVKIDEAPGAGETGQKSEAPAASAPAAAIEATRRAGASAAQQARALINRGGKSPPLLAVPRPPGAPGADHGSMPAKRARTPARGGGEPDTTQ